jgi:cytochrome c oxidase subunit 1
MVRDSDALKVLGIRLTSSAMGWLVWSVAALALSGLLAVGIVAARVPWVQSLLPWQDSFRPLLVVHVDCSVLLWFAGCSAMAMAMFREVRWPLVEAACRWTSWFGMILLVVSPWLMPGGSAILNNYIPVLENPWFMVGLAASMVGVSVAMSVSVAGWFWPPASDLAEDLPSTSGMASWWPDRRLALEALVWLWVVWFVVWFLMGWSVRGMDRWAGVSWMTAEWWYEHWMWGPGHLLQHAYIGVMLVATLLVADASWVKQERSWLRLMVWLNGGATLVGLGVAMVHGDPTSSSAMLGWTWYMTWISGWAPALWYIRVALGWFRGWILWDSPMRDSEGVRSGRYLVAAWVLGVAGGVIGMGLTTEDTRVPAHYHGMIVSVSVMLMAMVRDVVHRVGGKVVPGWIERWHPGMVMAGQLLHIGGLAVSGGYGALRKTPGAMDQWQAQWAMGAMGLGGLLAIVAGACYVWMVGGMLLRLNDGRNMKIFSFGEKKHLT